MTQLEKEALALFRDYTHLQLKIFYTTIKEDKTTEPYELEIMAKALEYHREYLKVKLNKSQKRKEDEQKDGEVT